MGVTIRSYVALAQILGQLLSYDPLRGNDYELCDGPFVVYEVVVENQVAVRNRYDLPHLSVGGALVLAVWLWEVDPWWVVLANDTLVASVVFVLEFSCLKLWVSSPRQILA